MAEFRYKTAKEIITRINAIPRATHYDPEQGIDVYDDEVLRTTMDRSAQSFIEMTEQYQFNRVMEMLDVVMEDSDRVDYKLRERTMSPDFQFLRATVINNGVRNNDPD